MPEVGARATKWSNDTFLNTLRDLSDPLADACARDLPRDQSLGPLFAMLRTDADIPSELPAAFETFVRSARPSLEFDDLTAAEMAKLQRGQQVFTRNALPMSLILLSKSLQEGYQAPRLGKVLMMSGELESSTYRRVLGVLQMLIQVSTPGSFEAKLHSTVLPASDAALTAIRVRLMHAGLRGIANQKFPGFARLHGGSPIGLEDLLATLIGFSWLVVEGFRILKIDLSEEDAEAYFFVWRVFARTMGIHPPGEPKSWAFVPENLSEAREFYAAYSRRHYVDAAQNEEGVMLAGANLDMLARRMPPLAARIYMYRLLGPEASKRLGVKPVPLMFLLKSIYYNFPRAWVALWRLIDRRHDGVEKHDRLTAALLQKLVLIEYKGASPTYRVPRDISEIGEVVKGTQPGLNFGRDQFMSQVFPAELSDIGARREALQLDTTPAKGLADSERGTEMRPSAGRGLVGLALSGGGIRSATFALGAVQSLARTGCLKMVDYLSTVSGGGYTGSAISSLLNDRDSGLDGKAFPLDYQTGAVEPPAIRHLRNGSNYLTGGGLLNEVRLPMIVIRGLLGNSLLALPYLMLLAMFTAIFYPWLQLHEARSYSIVISVVVFLAFMWTYPAVTWLYGRKRTWEQRNRAENRQALSMLALIIVVIVSMLSGMISEVIEAGQHTAEAVIGQEIVKPVEAVDLWKWALLAVLAFALVKIGKLAKTLGNATSRLLMYLLGMTAPAAMFGAYLLLVAIVARSPFLSEKAYNGVVAEMFPPMAPEFVNNKDSANARMVRDARGGFLKDTATLAALYRNGITIGGAEHPIWARMDPEPNALFELVPIDTLTSFGEPAVLVDTVLANPDTKRFRVVDQHPKGALFLPYIRGLEFGAPGFPEDWVFAGLALLLFALNALWIDVNITSPHGFWRDRLSRVFLIRARWFGKPAPNDKLKLSELGTANPAVPYHIVNTSLNLTGSHVEDLPGRGSDFFMFSRRFCGSYSTGYCTTAKMEEADDHIDLGTAMAISSAATAPNAGTTTIKPLVFMLTLLNVRLDYWAPNPWYVQASSLVRQLTAKYTRPGPWYMLREAIGSLHARGAFVNLSDGGHIENLAVYELLRRRCKVIVSVDAEQDPEMSCASLAKLIRYARIDLGIEIDIDLDPLNLDVTSGRTERHWTVGTIRYGNGETGQLLYVKASVTGDEAPYVKDYRKRNPMFPQESTADQFFDEAQFESYRALGYHAMNYALKAVATLDTKLGGATVGELTVVKDVLAIKTERISVAIQAEPATP